MSSVQNITLRTDMNKINEYINQTKSLEYNPIIKLTNDYVNNSYKSPIFRTYINEYVKVLNAYIKENYNNSKGVSAITKADGIILLFNDVQYGFIMIKEYKSIYNALQKFEPMKDKIIEIVDNYYKHLPYANIYANKFIDTIQKRLKNYRSIDSESIAVIRTEFKSHINFYIRYKKLKFSLYQLYYESYPYWTKDYEETENTIAQNIVYGILQCKKSSNGLLDKEKHLSFKDAMLLMNSGLDINIDNYTKFFPEKALKVYQSRKVLSELSQN